MFVRVWHASFADPVPCHDPVWSVPASAKTLEVLVVQEDEEEEGCQSSTGQLFLFTSVVIYVFCLLSGVCKYRMYTLVNLCTFCYLSTIPIRIVLLYICESNLIVLALQIAFNLFLSYTL